MLMDKQKGKYFVLSIGEFWQTPNAHTSLGKQGLNGCPTCSNSLTISLEDFFKKANEIHYNRYNYSKIKDIPNSSTKLEIYCPKVGKNKIVHGIFWQTVNAHLSSKRGCSKCSRNISEGERNWLNSLNIPDDSQHRQVPIRINEKIYFIDGLEDKTNTICEYLGDYFHRKLKDL